MDAVGATDAPATLWAAGVEGCGPLSIGTQDGFRESIPRMRSRGILSRCSTFGENGEVDEENGKLAHKLQD